MMECSSNAFHLKCMYCKNNENKNFLQKEELYAHLFYKHNIIVVNETPFNVINRSCYHCQCKPVFTDFHAFCDHMWMEHKMAVLEQEQVLNHCIRKWVEWE